MQETKIQAQTSKQILKKYHILTSSTLQFTDRDKKEKCINNYQLN